MSPPLAFPGPFHQPVIDGQGEIHTPIMRAHVIRVNGVMHQKAVERDVFDARGVPEEPRDGVDARMRPRAELRLGEATEEAVHQPLVDLSVASQEEADGVHR